jgi:phospholipid/cholesterol/gamma-HCH transport system substrate-binding protein
MAGRKIRGLMSLSREFKVGLFIVLTTIIILLSLLYLAYEKGFFEKVFTFTLSSKSGDGFTEGMPVVFSGFNIGKVHALELNDNGIVLIRIKIPERHVKWVKNDSTFILYRPLIGASRIIVTTNNLYSPQLPENKIPEVEIVNDINDVITKVPPLIEKITLIAANLETLSSNLANPKGDFNRLLNNVTRVTDNLDNILQKANKMADKADSQLFGKDGTLPQINNILKDIIGKLEKLNTTVDNINKISQEASEGMKDFSILRSDIDDTVNALDDVVNKLDDLISSKKDPEFKAP